MNPKLYGPKTPLDRAVEYNQPKIADLLRKHGGKSGAADSIHVAAAVVNIEAVKQHLAAGADVNAKDDRGVTPLHYAAAKGSKEIAELLIAKSADVNAKIPYGLNKGETPLDFATHPDNVNASSETADLLRKHGGKTGEELRSE
ncbi:MAG: ankyrin repeat domain-containing protein [Nitrospinaceae bacterium]|nr:ankyrin repeat domain-containing protein [Nitrospinaceae bacterium]